VEITKGPPVNTIAARFVNIPKCGTAIHKEEILKPSVYKVTKRTQEEYFRVIKGLDEEGNKLFDEEVHVRRKIMKKKEPLMKGESKHTFHAILSK